MIELNPNLFTGNPLNRAGVARKDPAWIEAQRHHPDALFLPFDKGQPLIREQQLGWLTGEAMSQLPKEAECILLGLDGEVPCWAADATADPPFFSDLGAHLPLRDAAGFLSIRDAAIAGQALWLINWHRKHRFCAQYGHETTIAEAGFKRLNPQTGAEHFPRTDPVAIMLPVFQDRVCLGRSPRFPETMFSAFAGYVEACETVEECAARELHEEAGLTVTSLRYQFSQPWPFPSSLMMGFIAEVADDQLTLDPDEIVDARWFSAQELRQLVAGQDPDGLFVPPPFAIAHQLMMTWLDR